MNRRKIFKRAGLLAALGVLLSTPALRAQSGCIDQITNLISWLKNPPPNMQRWLYAHVASNQNVNGIVTYTSIEMMVASALGQEWLTTKTAGRQYFSNATYGSIPLHPFSPTATKTNKLVVQKSGLVTLKPNNGTLTHQFTARCDQGPLGVTHGFQPGGLLPSPYYTISWVKQEDTGPR